MRTRTSRLQLRLLLTPFLLLLATTSLSHIIIHTNYTSATNTKHFNQNSTQTVPSSPSYLHPTTLQQQVSRTNFFPAACNTKTPNQNSACTTYFYCYFIFFSHLHLHASKLWNDVLLNKNTPRHGSQVSVLLPPHVLYFYWCPYKNIIIKQTLEHTHHEVKLCLQTKT